MTEVLCAIIAALCAVIGIGIRQWLHAEAAREADEAIQQADYDGWGL